MNLGFFTCHIFWSRTEQLSALYSEALEGEELNVCWHCSVDSFPFSVNLLLKLPAQYQQNNYGYSFRLIVGTCFFGEILRFCDLGKLPRGAL